MMQFVARQIRPIDSAIIGAVADRVADRIPLSYRYITEDILRNHKDALLLIYGREYTDLMLEKGLISEETVEQEKDEVHTAKDKSVAELIDSVYDESDSSVEEEKLNTIEELGIDRITV